MFVLRKKFLHGNEFEQHEKYLKNKDLSRRRIEGFRKSVSFDKQLNFGHIIVQLGPNLTLSPTAYGIPWLLRRGASEATPPESHRRSNI